MADPVACWAFTCNDRLIKLRPEAVALSSEFTHAVNINSMELVVPDIDPEALPYVVEYMNHYAACHEGIPELPKPLGPDGLQSFPWEDHFVSAVREAQRLSEVMYAAHKLKVRGLMELSCAGVALQFLNSKCSLSATCLALGQVPDFTAEEQKQLATERQHYTSDPNGPRSRNEHMQGSLSFSVWMTHSEKDWESVDPRGDFSVIQRSYGAREWQKDDAVSCCHLCGMVFGYVMERRHHCRACGRIFCWRCTQHMYILPHDRRSFCIPPPNNNWWPWAAPEETKDQKVRVCDGCFVELEGWANAMMWTTVCEAAGLTVPQLWELCAASRVLRTSAMSILNTLRDLLYSLPGRRAPSHFALLWTNRHHLRGHSRWVVQLLKLLPADKWRDPETREFMRGAVEEMMTDCKVARKANCWAMMCSRLCQSAFTTEDAVEMLCDLARVPEAADLRRLCIARLQTCSDAEVRCFLPLLVQLLRAVPGHMAPEAEPLTAFLVDRAVRDKTLGCELYWSLTVAKASEVPGARALYRTARHRLRDRLFAETDLKVLSVEALERFVEALEALQPLASADPPQVQARLRSLVPQADYFGAEWPFVVPTSPTQRCTSLLVDQTKFMTSNARPVRLAFACADRDAPGDAQSPPPVPGQSPLRAVHFDDSAGREVVSLYKRDDLRVDCIIMSVIRYMKLVLDKEFSDASIGDMVVTYNVVPVSPKAGFIEWVPNCKDVFSINNRDEVNMQSWVYRQPVNRLDTLANVQKRFVESTAAYTVISYLLGVGDRHKHNFMVTTKGMFFHIDYGYVLGLNPNSICMRAHLRLTKQMVAFMGGLDSDGYRDFKHLMIKIFHCLRRRYSIIMRMLLLLAEADPVIEDGRYSRSLVEAEIVSRFAPDKKDKDAEQAFLRRLESDADDQDETWGDLAHRISTDRVVPGMLWKAATTVSETAAFVGSNAYHIGCQLSAGAQDYLGSRGQAQ